MTARSHSRKRRHNKAKARRLALDHGATPEEAEEAAERAGRGD